MTAQYVLLTERSVELQRTSARRQRYENAYVELAATITRNQSLVYSWKKAAHLDIPPEDQEYPGKVWEYGQRLAQIASGMGEVRQELGERASALPMSFAYRTLELGLLIDAAHLDFLAMAAAIAQSITDVGNQPGAWNWSDAQKVYEATPRVKDVDWDRLRSGATTDAVISTLNRLYASLSAEMMAEDR